QRRGLGLLAEPRPERLMEEAVAPRQPPPADPVERRGDRAVRGAERRHDRRELGPPRPRVEPRHDARGDADRDHHAEIAGADRQRGGTEAELAAMVAGGMFVRVGGVGPHIRIVRHWATMTRGSSPRRKERPCFSQSRRSSSGSATRGTSPRGGPPPWSTWRRAWGAPC